jgi:hypothetical protein
MDAGACLVGTADCCHERVLQDLDLAAGSAGGAPVFIIGGRGRRWRWISSIRASAGPACTRRSSGLRVRLPDEQPGGRTVTIRQVRVVLAAAAEDGGLAGGAGRQRRGDGVHGVYWWPVYHALAGERIEVRVCNAAHCATCRAAKTASGSPSCTSTGCWPSWPARAMRKKIPGLQMACDAGSPPRTARCAGCTWTPATTSPRRSQNGTS